MSVFGATVSMSRRVIPCATFTECGSPPAATRFTMSRSVTMPASLVPSSTTTDEIPFVRITLATSANVSSAPAVFTSVCMISPTCIVPPQEPGSGAARVPRRVRQGSVVAAAAEVEAVDLQGGHARGAEEELARELGVAPDHGHRRERLKDRLREAEVHDRAGDLSVLDQEGAVTGHARD